MGGLEIVFDAEKKRGKKFPPSLVHRCLDVADVPTSSRSKLVKNQNKRRGHFNKKRPAGGSEAPKPPRKRQKLRAREKNPRAQLPERLSRAIRAQFQCCHKVIRGPKIVKCQGMCKALGRAREFHMSCLANTLPPEYFKAQRKEKFKEFICSRCQITRPGFLWDGESEDSEDCTDSTEDEESSDSDSEQSDEN